MNHSMRLASRLGSAAALGALIVGAASATPALASQEAPQRERSIAAQEAPGDIVETAIAAGDFTTLVAAVEAAGLVETLQGPGPFTVFAPTDAAFEALPEGTLEGLLADPAALAEILTYHVVAGEVPAEQVVELDEATTVQGSDVQIEVVDGQVILNDSVVVTATDVMASNGIIHVIDGVLLPPEGPATAATPSDSSNPATSSESGNAGTMPGPASTGNAGFTEQGSSMALAAGMAVVVLGVVIGARRLTGRWVTTR